MPTSTLALAIIGHFANRTIIRPILTSIQITPRNLEAPSIDDPQQTGHTFVQPINIQ